MSELFDAYLADLDDALEVWPARRQRILAEARDHLEDAADAQQARGASRDGAEHEAVAALGAPEALAGSLATGYPPPRLAAARWVAELGVTGAVWLSYAAVLGAELSPWALAWALMLQAPLYAIFHECLCRSLESTTSWGELEDAGRGRVIRALRARGSVARPKEAELVLEEATRRRRLIWWAAVLIAPVVLLFVVVVVGSLLSPGSLVSHPYGLSGAVSLIAFCGAVVVLPLKIARGESDRLDAAIRASRNVLGWSELRRPPTRRGSSRGRSTRTRRR